MKKYFWLIVLQIFALSFQIYSQGLQTLLTQGIEKAYNMELDDAEKIFNRVIDLYPQQPHGYFRVAQIHFWKYLGTKDDGEYLVFLKFADFAQEKIDKSLDENEKNYRLKHLAGDLASFKAMAFATHESSVDAFWASKTAVNYFEETIELNPRFYDAYLGLGLFDYAMGFVPDFLKWAVNLTGLSSDKERGLRYIKTAYYKGSSEKIEAAFHLAKIFTDYIADYDSAYFFLNSIIPQYPKNTLFLYQYAVSLIKDKKLDRAMEYLNNVIRLKNRHIPQITALAHYRKGEIYFKKNNFKSAIREYEEFLKLSKELDFAGIAAYNIAISNKIIGNEEEYRKYLIKASEGNPDLFEDSYAQSKSEIFLKNELDDNDLVIIKAKNFFDSGKNRIAYDTLKSILPKLQNQTQKVLALTYFSEAALNIKRYAESVKAVEEILSLQLESEKWVIPFSYLIQAKAHFLVGSSAEANKFLQEAENENEHEFQDQIQAQIENLKRKLKKK